MNNGLCFSQSCTENAEVSLVSRRNEVEGIEAELRSEVETSLAVAANRVSR